MFSSGIPFINRGKTTRTSVSSGPPSEEPLKDYTQGGYHPVSLGDIFQDRYKVVRKLGWGGYSTVWSDRHVAVKILTAEASASRKLHELQFLQHIRDHNRGHRGYSRVVQLLDNFHHAGPHGSHLCIVSEVLGESVQWLCTKYEQNILPVPIIKQITRQVLWGLDYLHSCNIIHTDLKADNFLLEIDDVEAMIRQEQSQHPPRTYPPVSIDGGPSITYVESQPLPIGDENYLRNLREVKVKISDLGVACWADKVSEHIADLIQSPALRAPEVEIGAGWDKSCDTWSMGCNVYQMLVGRTLFPLDIGRPSHVAIMIVVFGDFPLDLIKRGKYSDEFFKDGKFIVDIQERSPLPDKMKWIYQAALDDTEIDQMNSFLGAMLKLEPRERASPAELAEHKWLQA
ncbi:Serine/threonine-protein kinase SRPK [Grifola frondosa]|uniref:non-specific serine/threonine protein kinase n=1 Tax=Grifola frondosa TaxID=5627 RepID=A0A1C7MEP8_GRIFR|nr:Serine/threonine-protein kinase SRPK [Grifola frondosa]